MTLAAAAFFACAPKDVTLRTPVQDETTGKWGYANAKGKVIISGKYDHARDFKEGLAVVYNGEMSHGSPSGGKYGFIDSLGVEVIPLKYDGTSGFSEGLAAVNVGGQSGRKNTSVRTSSGTQTWNIPTLSGGKWGYIDRTGKEVIPVKYDDAYPFTDGKAMVTFSENGIPYEVYIDYTGNFITSPVEHSFIAYRGEKAVENGQTLVVTFTLETRGEEHTIDGYKAEIGKRIAIGYQTTYNVESFATMKANPDGTFEHGSGLSGTVRSGRVDCVLARDGEQKYTFTAYPEQ